jgi:excisionase family DNA binding protein
MARRLTPNTPIVPSEASVEFATKLLRELEADSARFVVQDRQTGTEIEIDETVFDLIRLLLITVASNRAVSLIPYDHELTTHQAARFLNVSRPYLVRLLDDNKIPHRKVGTHRRVRLEDLLNYKEATKIESEKAKEELAKISQENDMGY